MAVPVLYCKERTMCYTIEDITDDEVQNTQDFNEAFHFDLEFPTPFHNQLPEQHDQIS